jgi:phage terminase small subunit
MLDVWRYWAMCGIIDGMLDNGLRIMETRIGDRIVELSEEQLTAYGNLTKLQKGAALASLAGMKPAEAHRQAGGTCKNESHRSRLGAEILNKPEVVRFVLSMAVEPSAEIASAVLSRDEILMDLTDIARTTIDDVVTFSERPLVDMENGMQVLTSTIHVRSISEIPEGARKSIKSVKQTKNGLELVMHDSLVARKQIAEMCGYNAPTKTEISGPDGKPIQIQEIPDEELEAKLKALGLGRYHNQLGSKRVE